MNSLHLKIFVCVIIGLVVFATGIWMNKTGKPYNSFLLTLHKLIVVCFFVYLSVICYQLNKSEALSIIELTCCWLTISIFICAIITGGLISADIKLPLLVNIIHKAISFVSVITTGILIYLLRDRL
jgi:hypothetical protein